MRQLTGLDASFLYLETDNRILALPTMTQSLMTVPFELDHHQRAGAADTPLQHRGKAGTNLWYRPGAG